MENWVRVSCISLVSSPKRQYYLGELEGTMLESFCSLANLRGLLKSIHCPDVLKTCWPIIKKYLTPRRSGTLASDIASFEHTWLSYIIDESHTEVARADQMVWDFIPTSCVKLDRDLSTALEAFLGRQLSSSRQQTRIHARFTLAGVQYSRSSANIRESCVFYDPNHNSDSTILIPGLIREIVSVIFTLTPTKHIETFYFMVQRFQPLHNEQQTTIQFPFLQPNFEDFRASLWSKQMVDVIDVLPLTGKICQGIYRPWDETSFIMRAIDKVRFSSLGKLNLL